MDLNGSQGLTTEVAATRLKQSGPNSMPVSGDRPWLRALGKLWSPVPWLLEVVIGIDLFLGNRVEAGIIMALLVFNALISFVQEGRARKTLELLKSRLELKTSVKRDGVWKILPASELVDGDIIKISLGRVVPADVQIIDGSVLIDQSMITGESIPVELSSSGQAYAGALVRRGEAVAEVLATGTRTKFGRSAELVRTAHVSSSQEKVVFKVVRNLAFFNFALILLMIVYGLLHGVSESEMIPLILTGVLTSIPVALPANFALSAALGAKTLAKSGVLPTRLSAVDEAASMDVLCADKTGTLTQNELSVTKVVPMPGFDERTALILGALASSEGGQDSVDLAIRSAASRQAALTEFRLIHFVPFDPATKMSEARVSDASGKELVIVKGALSALESITGKSQDVSTNELALQKSGYRVLAVGFGPSGAVKIAGLIALSDPPRSDSAVFVRELKQLGVRTVMITGDAPTTASVIAKEVGIEGEVYHASQIPERLDPSRYAVFARILPEDKFHIVKAFQSSGHIVGMCGDGVNDAPALRQAQMGTAVSTATDVAKSAAGIVLTEPGLGGIVAAVKEGRRVYQRILTYTLRSITHKFRGALFLAFGLFMTGRAVLTPTLLVISMVTSDFLSLLTATDNVQMSPKPNVWRIGTISLAGIALGFCDLLFFAGVLFASQHWLRFDIEKIRSISVLILVYNGQAVQMVVRERRYMWSSWPSGWLMFGSALDMIIITVLVTFGILMSALPGKIIVWTLLAVVCFTVVLDQVKVRVFKILEIK